MTSTVPSPDTDRPLWNDFYRAGRFLAWYPSEGMIRFAARRLRSAPPREQRVLDLGCGNGRNISFLRREGYSTVGTDLSMAGLQLAWKRMCKEGLASDLHVLAASGDRLPFADGSFAGAISGGVLDHMPLALARKIMGEVRRVLQPGAWFCVSVRADRDSEFGEGEEIEAGTFRLEGDCEGGLPQHFFSEEEMLSLADDFEKPSFEVEERILGPGLEKRFSRWYLEARRGFS